jgi:hypothetical protein
VERAARNTRRQVARIGCLALLLTACATIQEPPGGPPDFDPPIILSVTPDSGAVVDDFDDAVQVQFNEVIDERSGSGLENLVLLSPRPEELDVSWKRSRVTIEPKDGWHENIVYQLTLLPGFADLRSNRIDSGRTIAFSTGGQFPETLISGTVLDWEQGSSAPRALIEAILLPDSLVFIAHADSLGEFQVRYLHPGSYLVVATIDGNNNLQRDYREVFDSVTVGLDSAVSRVLWAFAHDTVGPRISEISELDSVTIKIDFGQKLLPLEPIDSVARVYALPDTTLLETVALWNQITYDSVRTIEAEQDSIRQAAVADSVAASIADSIVAAEADSIAALEVDSAGVEVADTAEVGEAGDTTAGGEGEAGGAGVADSIVEGLLQVVDSAGQAMEDSAAADTSHIELLLAERPQLSSSWYVRLAAAMVPGARYLITAVAENISGAVAESQGLLILPEPVDTTQVPADTT